MGREEEERKKKKTTPERLPALEGGGEGLV